MAQKKNKSENEQPAHKSPKAAPIMGASIQWEGRRLPLTLHQGMWRIRSRSKAFPVDISTGTSNLNEAKRIAREKLEALGQEAPKVRRGGVPLERICELYLKAPKRCNERTARGNVSALRAIAKKAWGKTLSEIPLSRVPELWPAYVAARQGREQPDYAARREVNHAITARMMHAVAIFMPALRPWFRSQGVVIPEDSALILYPACGPRVPASADDAGIVEAWGKLREMDLPLWLTIGLARFAGLRQAEIAACRGKWIRQQGPAAYIDLKDREEDDYWHKTGKWYAALVLSPELAEYLATVPPEELVVKQNIEGWIERVPQSWLRRWTDSVMPLHRLRGLYADQLKRETEVAMLARAAAIKEASRNLGHTSTRMTEDHYLTPDGQ